MLRHTFIIAFSSISFSVWPASDILPIKSLSEANLYKITLGHPPGYVKTVTFKQEDIETCDSEFSKYFHAFKKSYSYEYMLAWNKRIDLILEWKADEKHIVAHFAALYFLSRPNIRFSKIDGMEKYDLRNLDTPCQVSAYSDGGNQGYIDAMRDLLKIEIENGIMK
ncbi:MAG: hypothetical protein WAV95_10730 [Azonexus sp.]